MIVDGKVDAKDDRKRCCARRPRSSWCRRARFHPCWICRLAQKTLESEYPRPSKVRWRGRDPDSCGRSIKETGRGGAGTRGRGEGRVHSPQGEGQGECSFARRQSQPSPRPLPLQWERRARHLRHVVALLATAAAATQQHRPQSRSQQRQQAANGHPPHCHLRIVFNRRGTDEDDIRLLREVCRPLRPGKDRTATSCVSSTAPRGLPETDATTNFVPQLEAALKDLLGPDCIAIC